MIFDKFADGFEAIIRPANPNGFALRLRGKLLLGISRLHRAKVIQRNKAQQFFSQRHVPLLLSGPLLFGGYSADT